jgi:hypothetical protein
VATTLKAIINSGSVAAGATATLAHTLNIDGVGQVPDTIEVDNAVFDVLSADATNVVVQNTSGSAASVNVLVEHWYSVERVFGASGTTALSPQPFISTASQPDLPSNIFPAGTEELRYVRSATGDDANDGLTPATAWQTLNKGLGFLAGFSTNRRKTLDVSDSTFSATEQLNFPALFGGVDADLSFAGSGPNNFFFRTIGQIRAEQSLQQALTVTNVTPDATTGLPTLTVSQVLVPNAHVGQFVIGAGLAEYGVVVTNDANTLLVASASNVFTAPVGAYLPSTTFTFGDAANFFQQATYINMFAHFTVQGISFLANGANQTALTVLPSMPWNMQLCQLQGLTVLGGSQLGTMDACYITRRYGQDGASMICRSSFFDAVTFENHGDGASGLDAYISCFFDGCNPVLAGNFESRMGVQMQDCEIANGTAEGILVRGANVNRIEDTRIRDCATDGIIVDAPVRLRVDNVVGTNNGGFGARLQNGAQVEVLNGPTLTGASGQVSLGGTGATTWAAAPATDVGAGAPQFCRIF